jgi:YD repeat-containing protein
VRRAAAHGTGPWHLGTALVVLLLASTGAAAAESVTYSYDALGRLIRTQRSGGPASGVDAQTTYDRAGNRAGVVVANAPTNTPPPPPGNIRVIVLPLNGFTVIPIGN